MRLTMKPGMSRAAIVVLPNRWASSIVVWYRGVRGRQAAHDLDQLHDRHRVHEVHADHPIGPPEAAASLVIEIDEVFDARMPRAGRPPRLLTARA
jgi:hypothetical protein